MLGEWVCNRVSLEADPKVRTIAASLMGQAAFASWISLAFGLPGERYQRTPPVTDTVTVDVTAVVTPPRPALRSLAHLLVDPLVCQWLIRVWAKVNELGRVEGDDSIVDYADLGTLDGHTWSGVPHFGEAMASVGWALQETNNDGVTCVRFPKFLRQNRPAGTRGTKKYASDSEKQAAYRERKKVRDEAARQATLSGSVTVPVTESGNGVTVTVTDSGSPSGNAVTDNTVTRVTDCDATGQDRTEQNRETLSAANAATSASPSPAASRPKPKKTPAKPALPRERDPLFDAVVEVTHLDPAQDSNGSRIGKVVASLKKTDPVYTPAEVRQVEPVIRKQGFACAVTPEVVEKYIGWVRNPPPLSQGGFHAGRSQRSVNPSRLPAKVGVHSGISIVLGGDAPPSPIGPADAGDDDAAACAAGCAAVASGGQVPPF